MANTKNKPGIHLYMNVKSDKVSLDVGTQRERIKYVIKKEWYWHARAGNGRITANGETYSCKSIALNSIRSTSITLGGKGKFKYYDHSKPDSPLISYL